MNKIAKILSVVLSAVLALSVSIVMLVSAFAAATPVLSLNVIEDNDDSVVVVVKLDKGDFNAIDLQVKAASDKIGSCISAYETDEFMDYMKDIKREGGQGSSACFAQTGKLSAALTIAYGEENGSIIEYTFDKNSADKVTNEDLSLVVTSCKNSDGEVTAQTVNNLPAAAVETTTEEVQTTDETTTTTAVTEQTTVTTTEASEPEEDTTVTTTEASEPEEDTTVTTTEAAQPEEDTTVTTTEAEQTEENTEVPEEATTAEAETNEDVQPADDAETETTTTTTAAAAAEVTTSASTGTDNNATSGDSAVITTDGDSVNPNTGDAFTTTAACASLLAISAAAVVALRKKED